MLLRIFPSKDTFITNIRLNGVPQTGSNVGASEILDLFKLVEPTGSSLARVLMQFDMGSLTAAAQASASFALVLHDANHGETLPSEFDVQVVPVSGAWDEGIGLDADRLTDHGAANWTNRTRLTQWVVSGGDTWPGPSASMHFSSGHEDASLDVSDIVHAWITGTGTIPNDGLMLKMTPAFESASDDYYVKMFHARNTHFLDKRPCLEATWADAQLGPTGSLVVDPNGPYVVNVLQLKNEYERDEQPRLHLYVRPLDYNPAVVTTASYGERGCIMSKAYYRITNDRTDEVVVPFATGSVEFTRLSYNVSGNFFDFPMSNLAPRNVYRLAFLFDTGGVRTLIDEGFKFRVV